MLGIYGYTSKLVGFRTSFHGLFFHLHLVNRINRFVYAKFPHVRWNEEGTNCEHIIFLELCSDSREAYTICTMYSPTNSDQKIMATVQKFIHKQEIRRNKRNPVNQNLDRKNRN
jgi:hypothetical protein